MQISTSFFSMQPRSVGNGRPSIEVSPSRGDVAELSALKSPVGVTDTATSKEKVLRAELTSRDRVALEVLNKLEAKPEKSDAVTKLGEAQSSDSELTQTMRSNKRNQAIEAIQRLKEEFKLIKKLYAHNPQEMARQLGRIAKALKKELKAYADYVKQMGGIGGGVPQMPAMPIGGTNAGQGTGAERQSDADVKASVREAETEAREMTQKPSTPTEGEIDQRSYVERFAGKLDQYFASAEQVLAHKGEPESVGEDSSREIRSQVFAAYGKGAEAAKRLRDYSPEQFEAYSDLNLTKEIRGFLKEIKKTFVAAKIQAALGGKGNDNRTEAFKDAEKIFKELEEDLDDFDADAKDILNTPTPSISQTA